MRKLFLLFALIIFSVYLYGQDDLMNLLNQNTVPEINYQPNHMLKLYLPARTAIVLKREKIKGIYDTH